MEMASFLPDVILFEMHLLADCMKCNALGTKYWASNKHAHTV